jgi:outer membrane protein OmpA-like peptidoglycan-associated protein
VRRAALALGGALLAAGCATDRVTLLDNEDGAADFAVADITKPDRERVIDRQLGELKLGRSSAGKVLKKARDSDLQLANTLPLKVYKQDFLFDPKISELSPSQLAQLDTIRKAAADRDPAQVEIEGFTDADGAEDYNLGISESRARNVANQLRSAGITILDENIVARGEYEARKTDPDGKVNPSFRKVTVIVR